MFHRSSIRHKLFRRTVALSDPKHWDPKTNPNRPSMLARSKAIAQEAFNAPLREVDELVLRGGGAGPVRTAAKARSARLQSQRARAGEAVAQDARIMSDSEWQSVSLADKQAFVQHMKKRIRSHPSSVSEQERRRFYETTELDPREFENPSETVDDPDERLRLGLPTFMSNFGAGSMGVSQAIYDSADAHLFDPEQATRIENAMESTKQQFVDYINLKREGKSTEGARRSLANSSQELNLATQKHLANMFRLAEQRVQETLLSERRRQLRQITRIREKMMHTREKQKTSKQPATVQSNESNEEPRAAKSRKKINRRKKLEAKTLREVYGVELPAAEMMWKQMAANERFLRMCEVITRMTKGAGFQHTENDEKLDDYVENIRDIYSTDASRLARVDAVQFVAAQAGVHPVDWSQRWYERALMLPVRMTPEYQEVTRMAEEEANNMRLETEVRKEEAEKRKGNQLVAVQDETAHSARADAVEEVTDLVQKMFLSPNDPRLRATHEKRLRYIAFLHMESQIRRMRANAKQFEGIEHTAEAAECRDLMKQIEERKAELEKLSGSDEEVVDTHAIWRDPEICDLFEKIQNIAQNYIKESLAQSKLEKRAEKALHVSRLLQGKDTDTGADRVADAAKAARRISTEKRRGQTKRILRLLEGDIREDATWLANLQEAERPPLLPEPEPMGYIGVSDVMAWKDLADKEQETRANPFTKSKRETFSTSLMGQSWSVPNKPVLFWGTGNAAVTQALQVAAEEAEAKRQGRSALPPPYPTAENPWGWRLRYDPLEDDADDKSMSPSAREAQHNQQQRY